MNATDKQIAFSSDARAKMFAGAEELAQAVRATLGPHGRYVVSAKFDGTTPIVTKDGVSVAEQIAFSDQYKNAGASLVKSVASKAGKEVGDGTTTSTVMATEIIRSGLESIDSGMSPIDFRDGISKAREIAIEEIMQHVKSLDDQAMYRYIATISANNDESIGDVVSQAFAEAGDNGIIRVDDRDKSNTKDVIDVPKGSYFERGFESPYFLADNKYKGVYGNGYSLILSGKVTDELKEDSLLVRYIDGVLTEAPNATFWLMAEEFEPEATTLLAMLSKFYNHRLIATKTPGFAHRRKLLSEDLTFLLGGQIVDKYEELTSDNGLDMGVLGQFNALQVDSGRSVFTYADVNAHEKSARVKTIEEELAYMEEGSFEASAAKERLALLDGRVVNIKVGAGSEGAWRERYDRYDDAIRAVGSAKKAGYLPGGGTMAIVGSQCVINYIDTHADEHSDAFVAGMEAFVKGVSTPFTTMCANAGLDMAETTHIQMEVAENPGFGVNFKTNQEGDMVELGVIDPALVTLKSIEIASELATLFLLTEAVIVEEPKLTGSFTSQA